MQNNQQVTQSYMDDFQKIKDLRNEMGEHNRAYCLAGYNDIKFHPVALQVPIQWIVDFRQRYQELLLEYYLGLINADEEIQQNPHFEPLCKTINDFVGYLNQEPPKE